MGLAVELTQLQTCFGASGLPDRVEPHAFHTGEINHEAAFANRFSRDAVTSAANREKKIVLACKTDASDDVSGTRAARNQGWPAVDHTVWDSPDGVIGLLAWAQRLPPKRFPELLYCRLWDHTNLLRQVRRAQESNLL